MAYSDRDSGMLSISSRLYQFALGLAVIVLLGIVASLFVPDTPVPAEPTSDTPAITRPSEPLP